MFNLPDVESLFQACISNGLLTLLHLSIGRFDSDTIKKYVLYHGKRYCGNLSVEWTFILKGSFSQTHFSFCQWLTSCNLNFHYSLLLQRKMISFTLFSSVRIVLDWFYQLIFYFEKFWTWICRLQFALSASLEKLRFKFTANGKRQIQVENFSE